MNSIVTPQTNYFPQWSSSAEIESQAMVARYGIVATGVIWLWDSLICIQEDFKLFKRSRISFADAAYILSRITTFGCLAATIPFAVAPVVDCTTVGKISTWFSTFALPLNSFLFLIRVMAVFHDARPIQVTFAFVWLAIVAGAFVQPFCVDFAAVGISVGCMATVVKPYCTSGIVVVMVHDTLVVLAISSRLLVYSLADSWSDRFKVFFSGRGMPHLSRLLMQTGQLYYAVTAVVNIFTVVVIFTPSFSPIYRATIVIPNLMVYNLMASHVFRKVKLGAITNGTTMSLSTADLLANSGSAPVRFASIPLKDAKRAKTYSDVRLGTGMQT